MPLVVEDGNGLSNSEAYCDVAFIAAFATKRGLTWPGNATTSALQEAAAAAGGDYLGNEDVFRYRGVKKTAAQAMAFPRTGCTERNGPAVGDSEIPYRLKLANARLAVLAANSGTDGVLLDLDPPLERGGRIIVSKVDVLSTTYADDAPPGVVYGAVMGLLAPLLRNSSVDHAAPLYSFNEPESPFTATEYENP